MFVRWPPCLRKPSRSSIRTLAVAPLAMEARSHCELLDGYLLKFLGFEDESEEENPMFTLDGVRKLHGWTHDSLALLLDHLSAISPADYVKALPAFGFPTLQGQVIHIFNCESFWIHTLQRLPQVDRNPAECPAVVDAR